MPLQELVGRFLYRPRNKCIGVFSPKCTEDWKRQDAISNVAQTRDQNSGRTFGHNVFGSESAQAASDLVHVVGTSTNA